MAEMANKQIKSDKHIIGIPAKGKIKTVQGRGKCAPKPYYSTPQSPKPLQK